jgi:hypothetical protein
MVVIMRAFTYPDGSLYSGDADIRDAHVHCSGTFEHWFDVRGLMAALANAIDGSAGLDQPMAIIRDA